jgi:hypothetical protein
MGVRLTAPFLRTKMQSSCLNLGKDQTTPVQSENCHREVAVVGQRKVGGFVSICIKDWVPSICQARMFSQSMVV